MMSRILNTVRRMLWYAKITLYYQRRNGLASTFRRVLAEIVKYRRHIHINKSAGTSVTNLVWLKNILPLPGGSPGRIAVHSHIFYPELAEEVASTLEAMPFPYTLFVSVTDDDAEKRCQVLFGNLKNCRKLDVRIVENRGRDIAPMVCEFNCEIMRHDFVCHIHTKKSSYNSGSTAGWREYLYEQLLGNEQNIRRIFSVFENDEQVGVVYPQSYFKLPYTANCWLANRAMAEQWRAQLDLAELPEGYFDYPTGSMFWARTKSLYPLFSGLIKLDDFAEEKGQTDGTLAHCLERLIGLVPQASGFYNLIIADTVNPSWSAWRIDQYLARGKAGSISIVESPGTSSVVAFDIFDTLLIRPLAHPEDTKQIVAKVSNLPEFPALRAKAEHMARVKCGRDVGLDDIYDQMMELGGFTHTEINNIRATEIDIETRLVNARPEGVILFRKALDSGKRVILISDTFLGRAQIEQMLEQVGIRGYHALYISSEAGMRKDSGDLYRFMLSRENISPSSVLMVGDNERSDWQIPLELGIGSLHTLRPSELARSFPRWRELMEGDENRDTLDKRIVLGMLLARNFHTIDPDGIQPDTLIQSDPEEIGYTVAGPVLVAFAQWLLERALADGHQDLFFLSREGEILQEVYESISNNYHNAPKAHYLVVSRRAVSVCLMQDIDDIRSVGRVNYFGGTVGDYLVTRFGLDIARQEILNVCEKHNVSLSQRLDIRNKNDQGILPVLKELSPYILENARYERMAFEQYLDISGFADKESPAVVDIGYGATVQAALTRLMGKPVDGYYLISTYQAHVKTERMNSQVHGCFAQAIDPENDQNAMWRQSFILEMLLSSDNAQVVRFEDRNGCIEPVYASLEASEIESRHARKKIRDGITQFVNDFISLRDEIYPDFVLSPQVANNIYNFYVQDITEREIKGFDGLVLDDHYCGRGIVSLDNHLEFMKNAAQS